MYTYLGISDKCRVIPRTSGLKKKLQFFGQQLSKFCLLGKCQFGLVSKVRHLHTHECERMLEEVVGSIPTEVKRVFLYLVWFPDSLY